MTEDPPAPQRVIAAACEEDLRKYGDSFRGVGYTKSACEAEARYALMLGVIRDADAPASVLDFGCGLGHLFDYIQRHALSHLLYTGLDISNAYLSVARDRHPEVEFIQMDVLESDRDLPDYDYVLLNGIFNYRGPLAEERMRQYWQDLLLVTYRHAMRGLAFNVMSTIVDWERADLFHLPFDVMAQFVGRNLSRHFIIKHDYRAYEYTTYIYRDPTGP